MTTSLNESKTIAGRVSGSALAEFQRLLVDEGLTQSAGVSLVFEEWVKLKSGATQLTRYATIDVAKFNLVLGEVVALGRVLKGTQSALRMPRPVLPKDETAWNDQVEKVDQALASIEQKIAALFEAAKIYEIAPPDLEKLHALVRSISSWHTPKGVACRQQLFAILKPWIGEPSLPSAQEEKTGGEEK